MKIVERKTSELKPYKNNPKIHTEEQIEKIAASIRLTKGLRQPIVIDRDNVVVCGHGRLQAAIKLGIEVVPCEVVDDLSKDEIRAYRILDNRISDGEYDTVAESIELDEIDLDLGEFGLDDFSIDEISEPEAFSADSDRDYFEKSFVFPYEKKRQIMSFLKRHQNEIVREIIEKSDAEANG